MEPTAASIMPDLSDAIAREVHAILGRYAFSEAVEITPLHQSENLIFLIRDPATGAKAILRVHSQRAPYHYARSIASELRWMQALRRDAGIETPEVIPARDGTIVQLLSAPDLDKPRHAVVFGFLEGTAPQEESLVAEFERLGEITARIHLQSRGWTPPANFHRHAWSHETVFGTEPLWGRWQDGLGMDDVALEILGRLADTLSRRLARLDRDRSRFGLVHADLRLANLLLDGNRTKVIDFDDCGYGWYGYDLGTAVSFLQDRPDLPELVESWLSGYRKRLRMPRDVEEEIPSFIMLRRMAEIAWIGSRRQVELARALGPGFTAVSCRLAEDYLGRYG